MKKLGMAITLLGLYLFSVTSHAYTVTIIDGTRGQLDVYERETTFNAFASQRQPSVIISWAPAPHNDFHMFHVTNDQGQLFRLVSAGTPAKGYFDLNKSSSQIRAMVTGMAPHVGLFTKLKLFDYASESYAMIIYCSNNVPVTAVTSCQKLVTAAQNVLAQVGRP